jgi:hypothetical protein
VVYQAPRLGAVDMELHRRYGVPSGGLVGGRLFLRAGPLGAAHHQEEVSLRRCSCRALYSPLRQFSPPPKESHPIR